MRFSPLLPRPRIFLWLKLKELKFKSNQSTISQLSSWGHTTVILERSLVQGFFTALYPHATSPTYFPAMINHEKVLNPFTSENLPVTSPTDFPMIENYIAKSTTASSCVEDTSLPQGKSSSVEIFNTLDFEPSLSFISGDQQYKIRKSCVNVHLFFPLNGFVSSCVLKP